MKHLYTGLAIAALAAAGAAYAHSHTTEGTEADAHAMETAAERVVHYEAATPATTAEALVVLQTKQAEIADVMANATLDSNHLEAVHQRTYDLEAASDKLFIDAVTDVQKQAVEALDKEIEGLHQASEDHGEAATREGFARLAPAIAAVEASFATQ